MGLTGSALDAAVHRASVAALQFEGELNGADGKLGDGDTGIMLRRLFERMDAVSLPHDLGDAFKGLAAAAAGATGSSLGTLLMTALLAASNRLKGKSEMPWGELGPVMLAARDAMLSRGGGSLGDKTVIDSIDAVGRAIEGVDDGAEAKARSRKAANETLLEFRDRPCRLGRARMFGDKSKGMDDPGMLAFTRLVEAVCGEAASR